jgi:hypothetical protein
MIMEDIDIETSIVKSPDGVQMEVKSIMLRGDEFDCETVILSCPVAITHFYSRSRDQDVISLFDKR